MNGGGPHRLDSLIMKISSEPDFEEASGGLREWMRESVINLIRDFAVKSLMGSLSVVKGDPVPEPGPQLRAIGK